MSGRIKGIVIGALSAAAMATAVPAGASHLRSAAVPDSTWQVEQLVSVAGDGGPANGSSGGEQDCGGQACPVVPFTTSLSADGARVAFITTATNLARGTPGAGVVVRDRNRGTTTLIASPDNVSSSVDISDDGNKVVYTTNQFRSLIGGSWTNGTDVFVRDVSSGKTGLVSTTPSGKLPISSSSSPSISGNGQYVAFESYSWDLVSGDTNGYTDIFVRDLVNGSTSRASLAASGEEANASSAGAVISGDGRYVAFTSPATNLIPGDTNSARDVFVRDQVTHAIERVDVSTAGVAASADANTEIAISSDGRYVAFATNASNLIAGDNNGVGDVFLRDRQLGTTTRVSVGAQGQQLLNASGRPSITSDGSRVVFESPTGYTDIPSAYIWNATTQAAITIGNQPPGYVVRTGAVISPDGSTVAYAAPSGRPSTWIGGRGNVSPFDLFVRTSRTGGYALVATNGATVGYGNVSAEQLPYGTALAAPIVGGATLPTGGGYWLLGRDGGVFSMGEATFHGSTGNIRLNQPVVGMAATPSGNGYWFVAADGGIFAFGDAGFFGSTGALTLNQPIVGMASTPSGNGYWLVARDGGIFAFGDAQFYGSTGAIRLNQPIVGMAATPSGNGYWFVASDGGVFAFGDAQFLGSTGNLQLRSPIVGMQATESGNGYRFVAADGGVFCFGDAEFLGAGSPSSAPVVALLG